MTMIKADIAFIRSLNKPIIPNSWTNRSSMLKDTIMPTFGSINMPHNTATTTRRHTMAANIEISKFSPF